MKKKFLVVISVVVLVFVGLVLNSWRLTKENMKLASQLEAVKNDPQIFAREEIKNLVGKLGRMVVLPEGEEPVLATVSDKEKLKDQPVFAKAENGDKILIYTKAAKAYIYRPSTDKIIDMVPVNTTGGSQQVTLTGVSENNPVSIALVNGSKNTGVAGVLEKRINDLKIPGVKVVSKATAKSDSYTKTLVMDISGGRTQVAKELAKLVGGEVATESGELNAKADMMVIIGADFK